MKGRKEETKVYDDEVEEIGEERTREDPKARKRRLYTLGVRRLSSYRYTEKLLEMAEYERECLGRSGNTAAGTRFLLQGELYAIRKEILALENANEKLLLYYHYIHGDSLATCAELLSVSRATAYRIHARAVICFAAAIDDGEKSVFRADRISG